MKIRHTSRLGDSDHAIWRFRRAFNRSHVYAMRNAYASIRGTYLLLPFPVFATIRFSAHRFVALSYMLLPRAKRQTRKVRHDKKHVARVECGLESVGRKVEM